MKISLILKISFLCSNFFSSNFILSLCLKIFSILFPRLLFLLVLLGCMSFLFLDLFKNSTNHYHDILLHASFTRWRSRLPSQRSTGFSMDSKTTTHQYWESATKPRGGHPTENWRRLATGTCNKAKAGKSDRKVWPRGTYRRWGKCQKDCYRIIILLVEQ